jgi:hypothetical protein
MLLKFPKPLFQHNKSRKRRTTAYSSSVTLPREKGRSIGVATFSVLAIDLSPIPHPQLAHALFGVGGGASILQILSKNTQSELSENDNRIQEGGALLSLPVGLIIIIGKII